MTHLIYRQVILFSTKVGQLANRCHYPVRRCQYLKQHRHFPTSHGELSNLCPPKPPPTSLSRAGDMLDSSTKGEKIVDAIPGGFGIGESSKTWTVGSWTLQWKGLNLYRRGRVLKIASFEGPMILRVMLKMGPAKTHAPQCILKIPKGPPYFNS